MPGLRVAEHAVPMLILAIASTATAQIYNVTTYGAAGNGSTLDSPAINAAIDTCAAAGGGTVYFPPGTYLSGSIRLKSNIELNLDANATILARRTTTTTITMTGKTIPGRLSGFRTQPLEMQPDLGDRPYQHRDHRLRHHRWRRNDRRRSAAWRRRQDSGAQAVQRRAD